MQKRLCKVVSVRQPYDFLRLFYRQYLLKSYKHTMEVNDKDNLPSPTALKACASSTLSFLG